MTAEELDQIFDDGKESMEPYLDLTSARRPGREVRRVNVDFPVWMIESLDEEAARLGITRQSVIKTWIGERLDQADHATRSPGSHH